MKGHSPGQALAELTTAATLQTEATHQRLVFAWGQILCTELRRVWTQLEILEIQWVTSLLYNFHP